MRKFLFKLIFGIEFSRIEELVAEYKSAVAKYEKAVNAYQEASKENQKRAKQLLDFLTEDDLK